jgi:hypothetical protein
MTMQEKSHKWIYITIVSVIVALMVAGVAVYRQEEQSKEAKAKAHEFVTKLEAAGLPAPSEESAARLFGRDGGAFIGKPDENLLQAEYAWWHGTAGTATRPVILDPEFVEAASIFVSVYAPEKMAAFQDWVDGLKTGDTTN